MITFSKGSKNQEIRIDVIFKRKLNEIEEIAETVKNETESPKDKNKRIRNSHEKLSLIENVSYN